MVWKSIPKFSKMCNELISCGCKNDKGCQASCKCIQASLEKKLQINKTNFHIAIEARIIRSIQLSNYIITTIT